MEVYLADSFSDEEGSPAVPGKLVYFRGSKADVQALHEFLGEALNHLESSEKCHMHLQDHMDNWNKQDHVDFVIDVGQE